VTQATVEKHIANSRAIDASGIPVMPTTDQPAAECHCDSARVLKRLSAGADHPVGLAFPEGEYLKGLLLRIE
jgi:hypothetical protein